MATTGDIVLRLSGGETLDPDVKRTIETHFQTMKDILGPLDAGQGVSDSWTAGGKTVTVVDGIITSIV